MNWKLYSLCCRLVRIMEPVNGTNKAPEDDNISHMPENVITNILDRLPIQAAVGTSILSRKWRFKWTLLNRLVFDVNFFCYLSDRGDYDFMNVIGRLLLHLIGPITKCILHIPPRYNVVDVELINHIMFLSRKGIKEFTLVNWHETELKLPSHLFSCIELKHLKLQNCCLHPPPTFFGFPNLLNLDLCGVTVIGNCVEIIIKCPLLEILKIIAFKPTGKVKLGEIAKLKNLRVLFLPFCMLDDVAITSSTIVQLGGDLPKLQELNLHLLTCTFFEEAGLRKLVCPAFPCLKTLSLYHINLSSNIMLSFAFEMICGSPNLQTLDIIARYNGEAVPPPAICFPEVDNNTKSQLRSVMFRIRGSENDVYLIKYVLDCSPFLEKVVIHCGSSPMFGGESGKLRFASKLLELHRASPIAEVKLFWF